MKGGVREDVRLVINPQCFFINGVTKGYTPYEEEIGYRSAGEGVPVLAPFFGEEQTIMFQHLPVTALGVDETQVNVRYPLYVLGDSIRGKGGRRGVALLEILERD